MTLHDELAGLDELVGRLRTEYFSQWHSGDARKAATALQYLAAQLAEARAENEMLRAALRVYAGPMEWTQEGGWGAFPVWADGYPGGVYVDDNTLDYGDAARAALKGSQP